MAQEWFKPKYAPPGMSYKEARLAGTLLESETYWIRLRHNGRTIRESTKTNKFSEMKQFLSQRKTSLAKGNPYIRRSAHVTFLEMAQKLKEQYDKEGNHRPTLDSRLANLIPFFGAYRMADIIPDDVERYIIKRRATGAANGTINREIECLARTFSLGFKLGLLTAITFQVRDQRMKEAPARSGFFEKAQFESVLEHMTRKEKRDGKAVMVPADDLQLAVTIAYTYGWRMQSEILTLERRHIDLDAADGMGTIRLDPGSTKNDEGRFIVLVPAVRALIASQLSRLEAFQRRTGTVTPYLFVHMHGPNQGKRIKEFRRTWKRACIAAGVPNALRHDFRRTAVRDMSNRGVPEQVAMQISGHKTRSVFDRYRIVSQSDHIRAAKMMATTTGASVGKEPGKVTSLEARRG